MRITHRPARSRCEAGSCTSGIPATIVVPVGNSPEKNAAMRALGVNLIERGADYQESREYAQDLAERQVRGPLDPLVEFDERHAAPLREPPADRRFARAAQAEQRHDGRTRRIV